jgi:hypothetical protein
MVEDLFIKYPERQTDWATQNMLGRLSSPQEYRYNFRFRWGERRQLTKSKRGCGLFDVWG